MKKSKIALFLLCILINGPLLATNFSFRHIGGGAGLSVKAVEGICSDNIGNMWFSSSNGLYRYNGADLKLYRHKAGDDDDKCGDSYLRHDKSAQERYKHIGADEHRRDGKSHADGIGYRRCYRKGGAHAEKLNENRVVYDKPVLDLLNR